METYRFEIHLSQTCRELWKIAVLDMGSNNTQPRNCQCEWADGWFKYFTRLPYRWDQQCQNSHPWLNKKNDIHFSPQLSRFKIFKLLLENLTKDVIVAWVLMNTSHVSLSGLVLIPGLRKVPLEYQSVQTNNAWQKITDRRVTHNFNKTIVLYKGKRVTNSSRYKACENRAVRDYWLHTRSPMLCC